MIATASSCALSAASVSALVHSARPSRSSIVPIRIGSASGPSAATASRRRTTTRRGSPDSQAATAARSRSATRSIPGHLLRSIDRRPQLEGTFVLAACIGEGERGGGRLAGPDRGLEGAAIVAGGRPVVGKFGPVAGGDRPAARSPLGQRLGECAMESLPLAGQEVVVGRLLEERVPEGVVALAAESADDPVTRTWLPTAVRSASSRSAPFIAATRARRSWSTRRPATAATPMTAWAGSGRATMRARRTSLRVGGRRPTAASSPAPSSSSTKNGLPSERRWIWPARSPVGGAPRIAVSSASVSRRFEAAQVDPLDPTATLELGQPRQERMAAMQLVRIGRS